MATSNPYAAPAVDTELAPERPPWLLTLVSVGLGIVWWFALLLPEASRGLLLEGTTLSQAWGFARVVGIVGAACHSYGRMRRAWPKVSWLSALVCLWGGSAVFAASMAGTTWEGDPSMLPLMVVLGPPFFVLMAWYVVLPMTAVTAFMLSLFQRRPRLFG